MSENPRGVRIRKLALLICLIIFVGVSAMGIMSKILIGGSLDPDGEQPIEHGRWGSGENTYVPSDKLVIFSLNMHYGIGAADDSEARRSEGEITLNLNRIADLAASLEADILMLQEVDFDSERTGGLDQMRYLAHRLGMPYMAACHTWKIRYLPFPYWPPSRHYGEMDSGQAVISRVPLKSNYIRRLPQPESNGALYNMFYLHRSVQHVVADVAGRDFDLFNVHLEAFDNANRDRQAQLLRDMVRERRGRHVVMAGDFNSVPPEATLKKNFPDEPQTDMSTDRTVEIIRELGLREVIEPDMYLNDEKAALTFPAENANRRLDYIWFSDNLEISDGGVYCCGGIFSDHKPLYAVFVLKP